MSYKTPVKKDLMEIILFKSCQHLKLYIILCILHAILYQTMQSFPNKCKPQPTNFRKCF